MKSKHRYKHCSTQIIVAKIPPLPQTRCKKRRKTCTTGPRRINFNFRPSKQQRRTSENEILQSKYTYTYEEYSANLVRVDLVPRLRFDNKLNWNSRINYFKSACKARLNIKKKQKKTYTFKVRCPKNIINKNL